MTDERKDHKGRVLISTGVLESVLQLPTGTRIKGVSNGEAWRGAIEFVVEHPHLPEVGEGEVIPMVDYTVANLSTWNTEEESDG